MRIVTGGLLVVLCFLKVAAAGEDVSGAVKSSYQKHVLGVRYGIHEGDQEFDPQGQPVSVGRAPDWELLGGIFVEKISLSDSKLQVEGPLVVGSQGKDAQGAIPLSKTIRFIMHLDHRLASAEEAKTVLGRVFYLDGNDPEKLKLEYRRTRNNILNETVFKIKEDKSVKYPKAEYTPEPDMTDLARKKKISGTLLFTIVVDKSGAVADVRVDRPLGYGLDQNAVESLKKWRFKPALRDGEPVAVQLPVEVSFYLY